MNISPIQSSTQIQELNLKRSNTQYEDFKEFIEQNTRKSTSSYFIEYIIPCKQDLSEIQTKVHDLFVSCKTLFETQQTLHELYLEEKKNPHYLLQRPVDLNSRERICEETLEVLNKIRTSLLSIILEDTYSREDIERRNPLRNELRTSKCFIMAFQNILKAQKIGLRLKEVKPLSINSDLQKGYEELEKKISYIEKKGAELFFLQEDPWDASERIQKLYDSLVSQSSFIEKKLAQEMRIKDVLEQLLIPPESFTKESSLERFNAAYKSLQETLPQRSMFGYLSTQQKNALTENVQEVLTYIREFCTNYLSQRDELLQVYGRYLASVQGVIVPWDPVRDEYANIKKTISNALYCLKTLSELLPKHPEIEEVKQELQVFSAAIKIRKLHLDLVQKYMLILTAKENVNGVRPRILEIESLIKSLIEPLESCVTLLKQRFVEENLDHLFSLIKETKNQAHPFLIESSKEDRYDSREKSSLISL